MPRVCRSARADSRATPWPPPRSPLAGPLPPAPRTGAELATAGAYSAAIESEALCPVVGTGRISPSFHCCLHSTSPPPAIGMDDIIFIILIPCTWPSNHFSNSSFETLPFESASSEAKKSLSDGIFWADFSASLISSTICPCKGRTRSGCVRPAPDLRAANARAQQHWCSGLMYLLEHGTHWAFSLRWFVAWVW